LLRKTESSSIEIKRQSGIKTLYVIGKQREAQNRKGLMRKLRAASKKSTINQQFSRLVYHLLTDFGYAD